jgi:predicted nucleic acid-binding protein
MSYLIDTNVLSELRKKQVNQQVLQWANNTPLELMYVSVLSLGEIRKGVELLTEVQRKEMLKIWLEHTLPQQFKARILKIDAAVASKWGLLQAEMKRPLPMMDSLLAATALHYNLSLVTRNVADFNYPRLTIINPWEY